MPLGWTHAQLGQLTQFLKEEQKRGNFQPNPGLPLWATARVMGQTYHCGGTGPVQCSLDW